MLATLGWWDKGSRKAASEGPTVPHNCICGLSNTSKWQMGQGVTSGKKTLIEQIKAPILLETVSAVETL